MSCGRARIIGGATLTAGAEAMCYPLLFRRRRLTWGATPEEVARALPGDELLPAAGIVLAHPVVACALVAAAARA